MKCYQIICRLYYLTFKPIDIKYFREQNALGNNFNNFLRKNIIGNE
jgi:hypothetical protein